MLIDTVKRTIHQHGMLQAQDKILVAVSGGPDSVALLHMLNQLRSYYQITLLVGHLNHELRGPAATEDQIFVKELALSLGLDYVSRSINVGEYAQRNKKNIEESGRILRLEFLREAALEKNAGKIALGHTQNDQAETVLMRFFRGSGLEGLSAIRPVASLPRNSKVIRPLIDVSRDRILQFLEENNLSYRLDASNNNLDFRRNRVRAELLPYLIKHFNPNIVEVLVQNAAVSRADSLALNAIAEEAASMLLATQGSAVSIEIEKLLEYPLALRRRIVRVAIKRVKGDLRRINSSHIESILRLARPNQSGKSTSLPWRMCAQREFSRLIFAYERPKRVLSFTYMLPIPGSVEIEELGCHVEAKIVSGPEAPPTSIDQGTQAIVDARVLSDRLIVRNRLPGDRYRISDHAHKTVKKMMIENKIPQSMRHKLPLIVSGSEIIWIAGLPLADPYKPKMGADHYGIITLKGLNFEA